MKSTTIQLTGNPERDIARLNEIKEQIQKENEKFLQDRPRLEADRRNNFIKKLFSNTESPLELKKKKLEKILSSEKFKKHFYGMQKMKTPLTWYQKLEIWFRSVIHSIDERFRKKSHIELLMNRIALMDEMNLIEKRVKLAKYGIDPMIDRDLEEDEKRELQNQSEELVSYRKELADFLKDDPEYVRLRDEEKKLFDDIAKNEKARNDLWEQMEIKVREGETDPRYHRHTSELPNDLGTLPYDGTE